MYNFRFIKIKKNISNKFDKILELIYYTIAIIDLFLERT